MKRLLLLVQSNVANKSKELTSYHVLQITVGDNLLFLQHQETTLAIVLVNVEHVHPLTDDEFLDTAKNYEIMRSRINFLTGC